MTEQQIAKTVWLNRSHFIKQKLNALYSIKENDMHQADELINIFPEKDNPEEFKRFKAAAMHTAVKSSEKYIQILEEYNSTRSEIEEAIEKISDNECQALLFARYIDHKSWAQIAEENFYAIRTVKYKHLKALDMITI